jgi:phosphoribosyl-ATP pyrophosphohydrolase
MDDDTPIGVCPPDCICIVCVTDRRRRLPRRDTAPALPADVASFAAWLDRKAAWSRETFGPVNMPDDALRILRHMDNEMNEICDAVNLEETENINVECADVILLAFDMMHRNGMTGAEIIATITDKQEANTRRTWPDWRTADPTMPMEHVKGDSHGE